MHHSLVITSQLRHFCLYQRLKALIDGQPWLRKGRDKQAQMGPGMGEGILPIHTNIKALLVVDGAGCELVEMDDHKLIARGWPVAKLLEYQWEDPLLTK
ncbi:StAR-related lipid transfer protein 9 [Dissostichus eleginoides]|uniref:StAR-related lipid transfer protein 9 n=1 Tax=Dissostichus eleginoides TaxID=100907 RepID=A0AAD9CRC7_DISEL|nr:StAR-related lipid transfer protein 9 [Dissostichus eleginoides]